MSDQDRDDKNVIRVSGTFELPAGIGRSIPGGSNAELQIQSECFENSLDDLEKAAKRAGTPYEREKAYILVGGSKSGKTNGGDNMDYTKHEDTENNDHFAEIVGYVVDMLEENKETIEDYKDVTERLESQIEDKDAFLEHVNSRLERTYGTIAGLSGDVMNYLEEERETIEEHRRFADETENTVSDVAGEMGISEDDY